MLHERLQKRCPSAKPIGIASVKNYKLVFHKKSADGSGKATLVKSDDVQSIVYGMLFELDECDKHKLDKIEGEGFGYRCIDDFEVFISDSAKKLSVHTYLATSDYIDEKLKPYDWYMGYVIAGAKQNQFDEQYLARLENTKSIEDENVGRSEDNWNIIRAAGY